MYVPTYVCTYIVVLHSFRFKQFRGIGNHVQYSTQQICVEILLIILIFFAKSTHFLLMCFSLKVKLVTTYCVVFNVLCLIKIYVNLNNLCYWRIFKVVASLLWKKITRCYETNHIENSKRITMDTYVFVVVAMETYYIYIYIYIQT